MSLFYGHRHSVISDLPIFASYHITHPHAQLLLFEQATLRQLFQPRPAVISSFSSVQP